MELQYVVRTVHNTICATETGREIVERPVVVYLYLWLYYFEVPVIIISSDATIEKAIFGPLWWINNALKPITGTSKLYSLLALILIK
jgi:hypothetical protein